MVLHRDNSFESVSIRLDAGLCEFPDTADVVIEVVESATRFLGSIDRSS
jgi:hypothetical protein